MTNKKYRTTNLNLEAEVLDELLDMGFNISRIVRGFLKEKLEKIKNANL